MGKVLNKIAECIDYMVQGSSLREREFPENHNSSVTSPEKNAWKKMTLDNALTQGSGIVPYCNNSSRPAMTEMQQRRYD